ncbi:MAG: catalase [Clostridium sp.]
MSNKRYDRHKCMTSNLGAPVENDSHSLTVGVDGPVVLRDLHLIDKLAHFDRERIPERVVHAKGAGAYGYFKLINPMGRYTKAKVFNDMRSETEAFVRFSTVIGSKGSADTLRDPRGFAVKLYTEDGNLDIVGNNLPVFFIRDAIKFPDLIHAFKPSPDSNLHDPNRFWDFIASTPESTHMITFLFSDYGTIKSFRKMKGFGVNTYVWVNEKGERFLVKYHWTPIAGEETITRQEAEILAGVDPDIATRDLYDTLVKGRKVDYDLSVQILNPKSDYDIDFDPLDATKTWPEKVFPLIKVGRLTLTRPPDNFFEESEQVAFCPGNIVPGVEPSNDKLLQGRLFSYKDTQRHRLGPNFEQIPINRPRTDVDNNERDGSMAMMNHKGKVNYSPNYLDNNNPKPCATYGKEPAEYISGSVSRRLINKENNFKQAGELYDSYTKEQQDHLIDNLVSDLFNVERDIQKQVVYYFSEASKDFGERVRRGLRLKK